MKQKLIWLEVINLTSEIGQTWISDSTLLLDEYVISHEWTLESYFSDLHSGNNDA